MHRLPALLVLLPVAAVAQRCTPDWSGDFNMLMGTGRSLALHDPDGAGPEALRLFVGGVLLVQPESPEDPELFGVGAWDGRTMETLGLPDHNVDSLVEHDPDGPGPLPPRLFAAVHDSGIWQGPGEWTPMEGAFSSTVLALTSWDPDGPGPQHPLLVACGDFTEIDGHPALRVAAWDGVSWTQLGHGFLQSASCLLAFDDDGDGIDSLIAGGVLAGSGATPLGPVARFSGGEWAPYPGKFTAQFTPAVSSLAAFDEDGDGPLRPRLYIGGYFQFIDGDPIGGIARFDGEKWLSLAGASAYIPMLKPVDPDGPGPESEVLYVGGRSEIEMTGLTTWNGQEWSAIDWWPQNPQAGPDGSFRVEDVRAADPDGDGPLGWQVVMAGVLPTYASYERALMVHDEEGLLWAGEGLATLPGGLIMFGYGARAMTPWDPDGLGGRPESLMIGGGFAGYLAARVGGLTRPVPAPLCCIVWDLPPWVSTPTFAALQAWDDDGDGPRPPGLYAGISDETEGYLAGFPGHGILRLDSGGWSTLGEEPTPAADAMAVFDPDGPGPERESLIAASPAGVARWDGEAWSMLGVGSPTQVLAMIVFDEDGAGPALPRLFATGDFGFAGGHAAPKIARWDGTEWSALGDGLSGDAGHALAAFDEDGDGPAEAALFVGGSFVEAGGSPAPSTSRWDGQWSEVGGGIGHGQDGTVFGLTAFDDDGGGPRPRSLFVAGDFDTVGGEPSGGLARWDGSQWERFLDAPQGIRAIHPFDDDGDGPLPPALFVAGRFEHAGGHPALSLARWGCDSPPECRADCDASGALDVLDWLCFSALFIAADPAADCDGSGGLDLFDFLCFVNAFNAGC